ncbi:MAG TPA: adenylate/guanylate cyclase domain-containing protein, partial [Nitrospiraceae bacterium]
MVHTVLRRYLETLIGLPIVTSVVVSVLVTLLVIGVRVTRSLEGWELKAYDWLLRIQPEQKVPDPSVVLLTVSEKDVEVLGSWPLSDGLMEEILRRLLKQQPRVIGVDIYRSFAVPPGNEALNHLLRSNSNIIMVKKFGGETLASVPAPPVLERTDQIGFNDLLVDDDGVVRRGLLFLDDTGYQPVYSFALRLALKYLARDGIAPQSDPIVPDLMRLGKTTFSPLEAGYGAYVGLDARGYQFMLDFQGSPVPHRSYSIRALLSDEILPTALRDKIVLVGVTAESIPDLFHTPYRSGLGPDGRGMYGVQLHAHIVSQLLRAAVLGESPRKTIDNLAEMSWIFGWGLLGGFMGRFTHSVGRFSLIISGLLVVLVGSVATLFIAGWWIPLVPSALAFVGSAALLTAATVSFEKRDRAHLMQLFSRHVSPEVASTIWQQRQQFWDGKRPLSQRVTITVLFSDLEGFTAASEKLEPSQLMAWMNTYVECMARLVMQYGGVVDDYFGDAIKANFGVPIPHTTEAEIRQDAANAVACAREMATTMVRLNEQWSTQHLPTARMRIGIVTGDAIAGSLGSAERLKYTTVGDTVNIAARLEGFQKDRWDSMPGDSPCRILIGESTAAHLNGQVRLVPIGDLSLKGKVQPVRV